MKPPENHLSGHLRYPERAKAERRRDIARRSFGEKIAMMEALRERLAPFKRLREQRLAAKRAAQESSSDSDK